MNSFMKGLLVGVGVGLLIAPQRGEETRHLISERVGQMRGYLPENEQLDQYRQQISGRMRDTASSLKDYAQQAASNVKSGASNLSEKAQSTAAKRRPTTGTSTTDITTDVEDSTPSTYKS